MKTIFSICLFGLLSTGLLSCTPEAVNNDSNYPQACCGDDLNVPPIPINGGG
ncbi:MAG: hypothetical protein WBA61_02100 [Aequorivita sp.]